MLDIETNAMIGLRMERWFIRSKSGWAGTDGVWDVIVVLRAYDS